MCYPSTGCARRWYDRAAQPCFFRSFFVFLIIASLAPGTLCGQQVADTVQLGEVQVQATRIQEPLRYQPTAVGVVDSLELALSSSQTLGSVLARQQGLFVRNYGPGAASTTSQRGLSATATQVLWNGMPINHPMLGQVDFSLLPADMFSRVEVSSGTGSSAYGGGSVGGAVYLQPARFNQQISVEQTVGTFGRYRTSMRVGVDAGAWNVALVGQLRDEENDFEYYDPVSRETEERTHNTRQGKQMMLNARRDGAGSDLSTTLWWSSTQHEVPGSVVSGAGHSTQDDRSLRWLTTVDGRVAGLESELKLYGSRFQLDYTDPVTGIHSESISWESRAEINLRRHVSDRWTWHGNLAGGYTTIETNNYRHRPDRYLFSARLAPQWKPVQALRLYPAVRLDSYSDFGTVISPSLGFNTALGSDRLRLRGQGGWNFNPPTFNDLYWVPGGNKELRPERSFKVEGGVISDEAIPLLGRQELTTYWIRLHDGIEWLPGDRGIWRPNNLKVLRAYGVEWSMRKRVKRGRHAVTFRQQASWSRSELAESRFSGDQAVGKQRAYVPEWQYKGGITWTHGPFTASARWQWTGRRFTTEDHQDVLDTYTLLDATLAYGHKLAGPLEAHWTLEVRNLLDNDYEIIQWYPMPGRNGLLTLRLQWK